MLDFFRRWESNTIIGDSLRYANTQEKPAVSCAFVSNGSETSLAAHDPQV